MAEPEPPPPQGLKDMLLSKVNTRVSRATLWGCGGLLILSLLKDLGVRFSPETTGWLIVFIQLFGGYTAGDDERK